MATSPIQAPLIRGARHSFSSIEIKLNGFQPVGFKSINYNRTRSRSKLWGAHPDPLGKTQGENDYTADCELYFAEFMHLVSILREGGGGDGRPAPGYGDVFFDTFVTYGTSGFDTVTDEIYGCTLDSTDASNGQGTDGTVRKFDLNPIKIVFGGADDVAVPLAPVPVG